VSAGARGSGEKKARRTVGLPGLWEGGGPPMGATAWRGGGWGRLWHDELREGEAAGRDGHVSGLSGDSEGGVGEQPDLEGDADGGVVGEGQLGETLLVGGGLADAGGAGGIPDLELGPGDGAIALFGGGEGGHTEPWVSFAAGGVNVGRNGWFENRVSRLFCLQQTESVFWDTRATSTRSLGRGGSLHPRDDTAKAGFGCGEERRHAQILNTVCPLCGTRECSLL